MILWKVVKIMRLIDADKLLEPGYTDMFDAPIRFAMVSRQAIETAPTVKAIPIEWIEEWQNRHEWEYESYFTMRNGKPKYAIECLLEDWEKENEENN